MDDSTYVPLATWGLPFIAEPKEVSALRSLMRTRLSAWGLSELSDTAQLCLSELVANVITHVGGGTPASLTMLRRGGRLRIEVRDPEPCALPRLVETSDDSEGGRGMALVEALTDRWGIELCTHSKVTWCELVTELSVSEQHRNAERVKRATRVLTSYGNHEPPPVSRRSRVGALTREAAAVDVITDLLHLLREHGHDVDEVLNRAQSHFEAEVATACATR
ncbi:ATP-binding protein [Streptomyces sp. H28]|uniref:ATP-binding protein n=1 Tax=Streptomyces sp. H28 TaxID=2775865 RepID=UPI00298CA169|nr:ATP-binding protein [Streptomyces sp. H28]